MQDENLNMIINHNSNLNSNKPPEYSDRKETNPKNINDLTFGRSPIKTPRRITRINNNEQIIPLRSRIFTEMVTENKNDKISHNKNNAININESNNNIDTRRRKEYKLDDKNSDKNLFLNINKKNLPPNENLFKDLKMKEDEDDINYEEESYMKKKKDWKSWSSQEKELFYEAIANGGNYTSLQKLFKNMNDVKIKLIIFLFLENWYEKHRKNKRLLLQSFKKCE